MVGISGVSFYAPAVAQPAVEGAPAAKTVKSDANPDAQAARTEAAMKPDERTILTHGIMPFPGLGKIPADAVIGAGYVAGIPRLGVPPLRETDAGLGVAYVGGLRKDEGATPLPSGMAMGSTWNLDLVREAGAMVAGEAHAKGFNVLLAGGANLIRDPRKGRTFEYLGEDPLHSGLLAGAIVNGVQSRNVISTVKHFALNAQETGRKFLDAHIDDASARESDFLAFQIAIERGKPGSVMCAYNQLNGHYTCDSDYLLNQVLKRDWKYPGFVMSDWGAVPGVEAALHGLDQQSGAQTDKAFYFADILRKKAEAEPVYAARLRDMNRRILRSIYAVGLDRNPAVKAPIDFTANAQVAERTANEGIVLLRNERGVLPLAATAKRIAVIGGYANTGVLSGGGSSQSQGPGGPALAIPPGGASLLPALFSQNFHRSVPLNAIRKLAPKAEVTYRQGNYITDAVTAAKKADVAIIFATQWMHEGWDVPDLSLPNGQDALIAAVAEANPNTIVVLETGGPVAMPWVDKTAAVLAAWYPGIRGAEAIANILFGKVNPSGHLPITFPASVDQLPRPKLDGSDILEPRYSGAPEPKQVPFSVDYNIEGSDVGYRWFARKNMKPLYPFGHGLSYTSFAFSNLSVGSGKKPRATFTVANTGAREGATVPQLYLVSAAGKPQVRLVGFSKLNLAPGERRKVAVEIDPRLLAEWTDGGWSISKGRYGFALGQSAGSVDQPVFVQLRQRRWKD